MIFFCFISELYTCNQCTASDPYTLARTLHLEYKTAPAPPYVFYDWYTKLCCIVQCNFLMTNSQGSAMWQHDYIEPWSCICCLAMILCHSILELHGTLSGLPCLVSIAWLVMQYCGPCHSGKCRYHKDEHQPRKVKGKGGHFTLKRRKWLPSSHEPEVHVWSFPQKGRG